MNNRQKKRGFTLVELMVVIAIIGVIMGLSINMFSGTATLLSSAGDQVLGQLNLAQQTAISDNSHVEVRFYQSGEDDPEGDRWVMATARTSPEGGAEGILSPYYLPTGTSISRRKELSTLISDLPLETNNDDLIKTLSDSISYSYTSFRFNADGSTNLSANADGDTWHLTLIKTSDLNPGSSSPPDNFYTIRIDPFTGAIQSFRP